MTDLPLLDRDLSWLAFNYEVLREAADEGVPLYERIKFLAIYSANLDEFFRVRVAALRSFRQLQKADRKAWLELSPKRQLKAIRETVQRHQEEFGRIYRQSILPALAAEGVVLVDGQGLAPAQRQYVDDFIAQRVLPVAKLERCAWSDPPPALLNRRLYFLLALPDAAEGVYVLEIPSPPLPRFVSLPPGHEAGIHAVMFVDDILRLALPLLLPDLPPGAEAYAIKLSRDAELYIDNEYDGDLVEKIRQSLDERQVGLPTRFLYDARMPPELRRRVKTWLGLSKYDLIPGARYHNFHDFFGFPNPLDKASLHDPPLPPLPPAGFAVGGIGLAEVARRDLLLHFPYQDFGAVVGWLQQAVRDPAVLAIKISLYRVADDSAIVAALLEACQGGKAVTVFVEAKARFDEAANLAWGARLEEAGARVIYSLPAIKVHAKLLWVQASDRSYAYFGTGNFNEKTSRLYTDHALLTADPRLTREAEQVFAWLEGNLPEPHFVHLWVAPLGLRQQLLAAIDREIAHAQAGRPARILLKMNNLEEPGMIAKLYAASQAGVHIRLIIRGICCLQPGVPGLSEHIEVVRIIDRFLEHARVFVFDNDGDEVIYLSSADWMRRNLFRRVEVAAPVYDPDHRRALRHILELQWHDNTKARRSGAALDPIPPRRAQHDIYTYLRGENLTRK